MKVFIEIEKNGVEGSTNFFKVTITGDLKKTGRLGRKVAPEGVTFVAEEGNPNFTLITHATMGNEYRPLIVEIKRMVEKLVKKGVPHSRVSGHFEW